VLYVMVAAGVLLIFRSQRGGRQCDRDYKGGADERYIPGTGHDNFSSLVMMQS
jgi:hypothetical protein